MPRSLSGETSGQVGCCTGGRQSIVSSSKTILQTPDFLTQIGIQINQAYNATHFSDRGSIFIPIIWLIKKCKERVAQQPQVSPQVSPSVQRAASEPTIQVSSEPSATVVENPGTAQGSEKGFQLPPSYYDVVSGGAI